MVEIQVIATPPVIISEPTNQTVTVGANVSFNVMASGTAPLSYQWRWNGTNIGGATSVTLSLTSVTTDQAGGYSCVVTNVAGSATSSSATLTIIDDTEVVFATHTNATTYPLAGGLLTVNCAVYHSNQTLLSLLWHPTLPAGFTLTNLVSGDGGPEVQGGDILFVGSLSTNPIRFSYAIVVSPVPPGQTATNMPVGAEIQYQLSGMVNPATMRANPDPLIVSGPLVAYFSATPTNGLAPLTVMFTNLSANATDFAWNFGDGNISTNIHPLNTYSNAGSYSVTLRAIGPGGTNVVVRTNYILVVNPALLRVTPAGLDFGLLKLGATAAASFVISNAGFAPLTGAALVGPGPFTILSGTPLTLEDSGATNLTVSFSPVAAGAFSNLVVITSTGGNASYGVIGRAADAPRLVVLPAGGTDFTFAFDTVPGLTYVVQFKDSLDDLDWQPAQSVPGDGTRKTITQGVSAPAQGFYRLWVQ